MSARQVVAAMLHDWTTWVVVALGTLGLVRGSPVLPRALPFAQSTPDAGANPPPAGASPTGTVPMIPAVPVVAKDPVSALVDSLIDRGIILVMVVMWGWQRWKETQRAEKVADDKVNESGLRGEIAAAKAEAQAARAERDAALKQVVDREVRIKEIREDYDQRLADRESRGAYLANQIADFKQQVAAQDLRLNDLLNQISSMAESMASVTSETKKTRQQVTAVRKDMLAGGAGSAADHHGETAHHDEPDHHGEPVHHVEDAAHGPHAGHEGASAADAG